MFTSVPFQATNWAAASGQLGELLVIAMVTAVNQSLDAPMDSLFLPRATAQRRAIARKQV